MLSTFSELNLNVKYSCIGEGKRRPRRPELSGRRRPNVADVYKVVPLRHVLFRAPAAIAPQHSTLIYIYHIKMTHTHFTFEGDFHAFITTEGRRGVKKCLESQGAQSSAETVITCCYVPKPGSELIISG